jgi:hypothetical protein
MIHYLWSVDPDRLTSKKPSKGASASASANSPQRHSPLAMDDKSSWRDETGSLAIDTSQEEPLLLPSKPGEPGLAHENILSRGLQVPSKSSRLTSGFEYPSVLASCHVSEDDWARFTREITEEAKLSARQWTTVVGTGLGTLLIGGLMVGFFSPVPAVYAAVKTRQQQEKRNLAAAVAEGSESALPQKIETWNESFFKPRGIVIRVDLPSRVESLGDMDVSTSSSSSFFPSSSGRKSPSKEDEREVKRKASRRGRIVIIPLETQDRSLSRSSTLVDESR